LRINFQKIPEILLLFRSFQKYSKILLDIRKFFEKFSEFFRISQDFTDLERIHFRERPVKFREVLTDTRKKS
jgi:hypothetical protein